MVDLKIKTLIQKFILISILISVVITKPCPIGELVSKPDECNKYNKPGHHCCFILAKTEPKLSMCLQLSKSVYNGLKTYSLGGVLYEIECGEEEEDTKTKLVVPGTPCGNTFTTSVEQCRSHSTERSSCCLYKNNFMSGCYHVGIITTGKLSIFGMTLEC